MYSPPRCFGLASMHGADPKICGDCAFEPECRVAATKMMNALQKRITLGNVRVMRSAVAPVADEVKPIDAPISTGLSKMALALLSKIVAANVNLSELATHRVNPFPPTFKRAHLRGIANLLLSERWVSESEIVALLIETHAMSEKSASVECRLIKEILALLDIVELSSKSMKLKEKQ